MVINCSKSSWGVAVPTILKTAINCSSSFVSNSSVTLSSVAALRAAFTCMGGGAWGSVCFSGLGFGLLMTGMG